MNKTLRNIALGISLPIILSGCPKYTVVKEKSIEYLEGVVTSENYYPATNSSSSKYSLIIQEGNERKVVVIGDYGKYSKEAVEAFINPNDKIKLTLPPTYYQTPNSLYFYAIEFLEGVSLIKDYKMEDLENK